MIAHNIIANFCIFSLLKYGRIFGKTLEHDTCGVKKSPWPSTLRAVSTRFGPWNLCLFSFFMRHLSIYHNIYETETWFFGGNLKVLLGHLYTCWTSEGVDITRRLTKWSPAILLLVIASLVSWSMPESLAEIWGMIRMG